MAVEGVDRPSLQEEARALGDPTRHSIFQYLVAAEGPIDVAELTAHFELNHNAIRQHLAKLVEARLVVEETAPASGPGRPRLQFVVDPTADSRWGAQGPYERLSLWLSEMVRTGDSPVEVGRRVGRRRRLGATGTDEPVAELMHQMASHGFEPTLRHNGAEVDITLRTCPFASTALADPDTVCQLHLGIAYGIAENLGGLVIDELEPHDPRRARCHLRGHLDADASA